MTRNATAPTLAAIPFSDRMLLLSYFQPFPPRKAASDRQKTPVPGKNTLSWRQRSRHCAVRWLPHKSSLNQQSQRTQRRIPHKSEGAFSCTHFVLQSETCQYTKPALTRSKPPLSLNSCTRVCFQISNSQFPLCFLRSLLLNSAIARGSYFAFFPSFPTKN